MNPITKTITIIFLIVCVCKTSFATILNDIHINGSLSQTYLKSFDNTIWFNKSTDGSLQMNQASLNAHKSFNNHFRAGIQVISRDFGPEGNHELDIDWGYLDYNLNLNLGLRLGRVRVPFGFHNESRDVDLERTSILLSQSIYPESWRSFMQSVDGISVYGTFDQFHNAGSFDYQLFYGRASIPDTFQFINILRSNYKTENISINNKDSYGLQLIWEPTINGLRFAYSGIESKNKVDMTLTGVLPAPFNTLNHTTESPFQIETIDHIYGVEYQYSRFLFTSEYRVFRYRSPINYQAYQSFLKGQLQSTYTTEQAAQLSSILTQSLSQAIGNNLAGSASGHQKGIYFKTEYFSTKWSASLSYDHFINDYEKKDLWTEYTKGFTYSFRYNFTSWLCGKLEYSDFKGTGVINSVPGALPQAPNWNLFLARLSLSF